jgi:hypothetical protein
MLKETKMNLDQLYKQQKQTKGYLDLKEKSLKRLDPSDKDYKICETDIKIIKDKLEKIKNDIKVEKDKKDMNYLFPMLGKTKQNRNY